MNLSERGPTTAVNCHTTAALMNRWRTTSLSWASRDQLIGVADNYYYDFWFLFNRLSLSELIQIRPGHQGDSLGMLQQEFDRLDGLSSFRVQGCRAVLPGTARWCFAVSSAVHLRRRHAVPTKIPVFILRPSACSDCQTFILLDVAPSLLLVLAYGTIYLRTLPPHRRCLHLSVI